MTYGKTETFLACRYMCKSFAYNLFVFPNMVLGKTEYSNAVNTRYTFQLLDEFLLLVNKHYSWWRWSPSQPLFGLVT